MKPEDIQRIDQAANYQYDAGLLSNRSDFKTGAKYEHPIAWNAAIEEALRLTSKYRFDTVVSLHDEIQKLKK